MNPVDPELAPGAYERILDEVRRAFVPDLRSGIFDVRIEERADTLAITGQTTHPEAVRKVRELLRRTHRRRAVADEVLRLPDAALGAQSAALVRAAIAPVYAEPRLPAPQISQVVLGMRVDVFARAESWLRIRAEDGYIGWVQEGYLALGDGEWARSWERGTGGEPVVSLGAELVGEDGRALMRLPWGARLLRRAGCYLVPDGRTGQLGSGELVDVDRLADWFPARGDSIARTARRWLGAPYLWGGVTPHGVDCSGFAQAVMWMHGVALPRDSDLQARVGARAPADDPGQLRAGDLLFFAEPGAPVSHVAIALTGAEIIHSALGNGGVAIN
ncbi:MAG TPA: SH3 domain-containing C40 family peptidase, partial [Longimicrobiales bacterium]|nr:SH3 domain-containing C40 family peptidase [Longimicrobiales bacterium]